MTKEDLAAERAVLAGVCRYNAEAYYDVCDIINTNTFTFECNQIIWDCVKKAFEQDENTIIDIPIILSAASEMGLSYVFDKKNEIQYLKGVMEFPVQLSNVRKLAAKIRKLQIIRLLSEQLSGANEKLGELTGEEAVSHILGIPENAIFDFSSLLNNEGEQPRQIGEGLDEYIAELEANPVDNVGIPTPYARLNRALGGGVRVGVNVIAARMKTGKSQLGDNIGLHTALEVNVPTLYLDSEMSEKEHRPRRLGMMTGLPVSNVEQGKLTKPEWAKVKAAADKMKSAPFFFRNIAGLQAEDVISIMRRWLMKEVGFNRDGSAKPCLIIYDYLKLTTSENITKNIAEYQAIGFLMTSLHNFMTRYQVPCLAFVQANRDGIDGEDTGSIAQSDRIGWLCVNLLLFKKKSDEEIAEDGPDYGTRKLKPLASRFAEEWDSREYINMKFVGKSMKIVETKTNFEIKNGGGNHTNKGTFEVQGGDEEVPFT